MECLLSGVKRTSSPPWLPCQPIVRWSFYVCIPVRYGVAPFAGQILRDISAAPSPVKLRSIQIIFSFGLLRHFAPGKRINRSGVPNHCRPRQVSDFGGD